MEIGILGDDPEESVDIVTLPVTLGGLFGSDEPE